MRRRHIPYDIPHPWFAVIDMYRDNDNHMPVVCPITGHLCEGDRSHLCQDYGCARKGGLSPHSSENV